jgi:CheY-like chemotaxis protein
MGINGPKGTVLVVEDDESILELVEGVLELEGYHVLSGLGEEALRLARIHRPAVILLDLLMPGMSGMEVSQRLRADPSTAGIPIICMSAQDRLVTIGVRMPVDDFLTKPFGLEALHKTVGRWAG